jgi:ubiquitin
VFRRRILRVIVKIYNKKKKIRVRSKKFRKKRGKAQIFQKEILQNKKKIFSSADKRIQAKALEIQGQV